MSNKNEKSSLNIVIPVYNEEKELQQSIATLTRFLDEHMSNFEWVVTIADNASTDSTLQIAKKLAHLNDKIKVQYLAEKGRGRAVKKVWLESNFDYYVYMDVDLSTDLKHLPQLVAPLTRGYDLAIGTRNLKGSRVYGRSLLRTITSKGYILLIKLFFMVHFSDAQCGFKAISRDAAKNLLSIVEDNEWFFDSELLILAEKMGYRIYEEPVTWIDNPGSTVKVLRTAQGDIDGLIRLFINRPWRKHHARR